MATTGGRTRQCQVGVDISRNFTQISLRSCHTKKSKLIFCSTFYSLTQILNKARIQQPKISDVCVVFQAHDDDDGWFYGMLTLVGLF